MYAALLEGRFLFDFVHQENLTAESLKPYRALVIPNAAFLRDTECEAIRDYVKAGGSVLATFESSRYNEWGVAREDFGLQALFGVSVAGDPIGPFNNSYMRMEKAHPVCEGFTGTSILPGPEFRVPVSHVPSNALYLSVVPHYPPFPPEMVYPRIRQTEEPAAIFREQGGSRIVYFPGDVGRSYWRSGNPDLSRLLINAVRWILKQQAPPASVQGNGLLETFAWETEPGFALHILNYSNPNALRPFVSQLYPVGPLQAQVQVPRDRKIISVRALRGGKDLPFRNVEGTVSFEIPSVEDYEVIALT
jgi:hypothetical protein